jgi:hypothetical protein
MPSFKRIGHRNFDEPGLRDVFWNQGVKNPCYMHIPAIRAKGECLLCQGLDSFNLGNESVFPKFWLGPREIPVVGKRVNSGC